MSETGREEQAIARLRDFIARLDCTSPAKRKFVEDMTLVIMLATEAIDQPTQDQ